MNWHEFFFGPGDVVQAFLQFLPAIGMGLSAVSGLFGARSASQARNRAQQLQQQQLDSARQFQELAQQEYASRDPMREMFMQRLMGFQGSPQNPFAAGMFGGGGGGPLSQPGQMGLPPSVVGRPPSTLQMQAAAGAPGAPNPYPQFGAQNNLLTSQIQPQYNRSALDALYGKLGVPNG